MGEREGEGGRESEEGRGVRVSGGKIKEDEGE